MVTQNTASLIFHPKPSQAAFLVVFTKLDKGRAEVSGDVISGMAIDRVGIDAHAKLLTVAELFDSSAGPTSFAHFYINAVLI